MRPIEEMMTHAEELLRTGVYVGVPNSFVVADACNRFPLIERSDRVDAVSREAA